MCYISRITSSIFPDHSFLCPHPNNPCPLTPVPRHLSLNNRYPQVIKTEVPYISRAWVKPTRATKYNMLTQQTLTKTPNTVCITTFCLDFYFIFFGSERYIQKLEFSWHRKNGILATVGSLVLTHGWAYVAKINCDNKDSETESSRELTTPLMIILDILYTQTPTSEQSTHTHTY